MQPNKGLLSTEKKGKDPVTIIGQAGKINHPPPAWSPPFFEARTKLGG
ncbi:MAG: hypothetical protein QM781_02720 [Chitinophagaceae bacterium]